MRNGNENRRGVKKAARLSVLTALTAAVMITGLAKDGGYAEAATSLTPKAVASQGIGSESALLLSRLDVLGLVKSPKMQVWGASSKRSPWLLRASEGGSNEVTFVEPTTDGGYVEEFHGDGTYVEEFHGDGSHTDVSNEDNTVVVIGDGGAGEGVEIVTSDEPTTTGGETETGEHGSQTYEWPVTLNHTETDSEGNSYTVTVTFGENAGIPHGAELHVSVPGATDDRVSSQHAAVGLGADEIAVGDWFVDVSLVDGGQTCVPTGTVEIQLDTNAADPSLSDAIEVVVSSSSVASENQSGSASKGTTSIRFSTENLGEIGLTAVERKATEIEVLGETIDVWAPRSVSVKADRDFDIPDALPSEGMVRIGTLDLSVDPSRSWPTTLYVTAERSSDNALQDGLIMSVDGSDTILFGIEGADEPVAISSDGTYLLEWDTGLRDDVITTGNFEVAGPLPAGVQLEVNDIRGDYPDAESVTGVSDGVKYDYDVIGAYDLSFSVDGDIWAPDADHKQRVTIGNLPVKEDHDIQVWHLEDDEFTQGEVDSFESGSFSFTASDSGVYVLIDKVSLERELTATDDETYRMTVTYDGSAGMPRDAVLEVNSLATEGPEYLMSVIESAKSLGSAAKRIAYAQMFDIALVDPLTGVRHRPSEGVNIEVELLSDKLNKDDALSVIGLGSDPVPVDSSSDGSTVGFEAADASTYAVVVTTVEKTVTASDGKTYEISVRYDSESGIPASALLEVTEIIEGDEGYAEYVAGSAEAMGVNTASIQSARAFDISFVDSETGEEYQPAKGVEVSIRLLDEDTADDTDLSIVHFPSDGDQAQVLDSSITDGAVEFGTDGFSVFVVVQTVVERILESGNGETYQITVEYDTASGIPANAELEVTELDEKSAAYEEYVQKTAEALGKEVNHFIFAHAFDITLVDPETGEHYQPTKDVKVSIDLLSEDVKKGDLVNVIHFKDANSENPSDDAAASGESAEVIEASIVDGGVTFESSGFSVYVVAETDLMRHYVFENNGSVFAEQVLIEGESLRRPPDPTKDGAVFKHWATTEEGTTAATFEEAEYNNIHIDADSIPGDTNRDKQDWLNREENKVKFYAVYHPSKVIVAFYNQSGLVVQKVEIEKPAQGQPAKTLDTRDAQYDYVPIQDKEGAVIEFRCWTEDPLGTGPDAGTLQITSSETRSEVELYPVLQEGHYLYFNSNRSGATYVAPIFLANRTGSRDANIAATATALKNALAARADHGIPTANGYTFKGWYLIASDANDGDGAGQNKPFIKPGDDGTLVVDEAEFAKLFDAFGNLPNNPTLYAHWTVVDDVGYTVIFWRQKITDDKNALDKSAYDAWVKQERASHANIPEGQFNAYIQSQGKTCKEYDFAESDSTRTGRPGTSASPTQADRTKAGTGDYAGFKLNDAETETNVEIRPDGTTVINVYYDRELITIDFAYRSFVRASNVNTSTQYYDKYGYPLVKGPNWNRYYLMDTGQYSDETYRYVDSRTVLYTKSGNTYDIATKPYNYNTDYFAKDHNGDYTNYSWVRVYKRVYYTNNNDIYTYEDQHVYYTGLYGQKLSKYYDGWPAGNWYSPENDSVYWSYVVTAISEFKNDFSAVSIGEITNTVTMKYYFQDVDGTEDTNYMREPDDSAIWTKVYTSSDSFDDLYVGMKPKKYKIGNQEWKNISSTLETIHIDDDTKVYFERISRSLEFFDPEENKLVDTKFVLFGAPLNDYKNIEPVGTAEKRFIGWYEDADCTTRVFFENNEEYQSYSGPKTLVTTMPAANKRVYARWTPVKYNIKIIPNGGKMPEGQGMEFNLDLNEKVSLGAEPTRDYVKVADGEGDFVYDEINGVYTEAASAGEGNYVEKKGAYVFLGWYEAMMNPASVMDPANQKLEQYTNSGGESRWRYIQTDKSTDATGVPVKDAYGNYSVGSRFNTNAPPNKAVTIVAMWQRAGGFFVRYNIKDNKLPDSTSYATIQTPEDQEEYIDGAHAIVLPSLGAPRGYALDYWEGPVTESHPDGHYQPNQLLDIKEHLAHAEGGSMIITLTARYRVYDPSERQMADYTFLHDANNDGVFDPATEVHELQRIVVNEELKPPLTPAKPGYAFKGWYYDKEGTRRFDGFGVIANPVYTTLYAIYNKVFTVNYYLTKPDVANPSADGVDKIVLASQTYNDPGTGSLGTAYERLDSRHVNHPVDTDHYVVMWVSDWDKQDINTANESYQYAYNALSNNRVKSDLNLYAVLRERQYVEFDSQGGSYVAAQEVPLGGWPVRPDPAPTRPGYDFLGWFTDPTDASTEYEFDRVLTDTETVLYAHWTPNGTANAEYTVIWWAQTESGGMDYEFQKAESFTGIVGSTVDITSQAWRNAHGNPMDVSNLTRYYSATESEDLSRYFAFTPADTSNTSCRPSEVRKVIEENGTTVFNVRFHRIRYTFRFDTQRSGNATYGTIHWNGHKYSRLENSPYDYYEFETWLNASIADQWPIVSDERQGLAVEPKPWVEMTGNYKFQYWAGGGGYRATLVSIAEAEMLAAADNNHVVTFKLNRQTSDSTAYAHYYFDGVENPIYSQTLYSEYGKVESNGVTYADLLNAKEFEGYEVITSPDKALTEGPTAGKYNPLIGEKAKAVYEEKTQSAGSQEPFDFYVYTLNDAYDYYYWDSGYIGVRGFYRPVSVSFVSNGQKNAYTIYYTDDLGIQHTLNSGNISYVPHGQPAPQPGFWDATGVFDTLPSWTFNAFKAIAIQETIEVHYRPVTTTSTQVHLSFFYRVLQYDLLLKIHSGDTENYQALKVDYGKPVSVILADVPKPTSADPSKTFDCWSVTSAYPEEYTGTMPAHTLVLYATWKPKEYTVVTRGVDATGNANDGAQSEKYTTSYNTHLKELKIPNAKKDGELFEGWKLVNVDGVELTGDEAKTISGNYKIQNDIEIEPIWSDTDTRTIEYVANIPAGLSSSGTAPVDTNKYLVGAKASIKDGSGLSIVREDIDDDEYTATFAYWNTKADGTGDNYYPNTTFVFREDMKDDQGQPLKKLTLYAIYSEYRETVLTYDKNAEDAVFKKANNSWEASDDNYAKLADGKVVVKFRDKLNEHYNNATRYPNAEFPVAQDQDGEKFTVVRTDSLENEYVFAGWGTEPDSSYIFARNGDKAYANTIKDEKGVLRNTLYAIWGICKIQTDEVDRWGVTHHYEHVFQTLNAAVKYVNENPKDAAGNLIFTNKTATIEMLIDYNKPNSDNFTVPEGCNITLTTATTGTLRYTGAGTATISRTEQGDRMGKVSGALTLQSITLDGKNLGGGIIEVSGGTLTVSEDAVLKNGRVSDGNGGAIVADGGTVNVNAGSITGNVAKNGAAIYGDGNATVNINGGSITENTATTGGAVEGGGTIAFSGAPYVYGNLNGSKQKNVVLDEDNTTTLRISGALAAVSDTVRIGVYATDNTTNRWKPGQEFASYDNDGCKANLDVFKNDREDGFYGVLGDTTAKTVKWVGAICKIVDADGEHPFQTLNAAVSYARDHLDGKATIQMLVDYVIPASDAVALNGANDKITLTTAETEPADSDPNVYYFTDTKSEKADADKGKAILTRGFNNGSLFRLEDKDAKLVFSDIIIDGDRPTEGHSGHTGSGGGLVYVENGTLDVWANTVLRNAKSYDNGGAVYLAKGEMNMTGGTIENCSANNGGGIGAGQKGAKVNIKGVDDSSRVTISGCTATYNGGGVFIDNEAELDIDYANIRKCVAKAEPIEGQTASGHGVFGGGAIAVMATGYIQGTREISSAGTVKHSTFEECSSDGLGGALYINNSTVNLAGDSSITGSSAGEHGSAVYAGSNGILNMSSGEITGNTVSESVGAVEVYDDTARLNFSGAPSIYDNAITETSSDANGDTVTTTRQKNIVLPVDSNAIVNTVGSGLTGGQLGVFVVNEEMNAHGGPQRPFGTFATGADGYLSDEDHVFLNDRLSGVYGVKGNGTQIRWNGQIAIKIMDLNSKTELSGATLSLRKDSLDGSEVWTGTTSTDGLLTIPWSVDGTNGGVTFAVGRKYYLEQTGESSDGDHLKPTGYWTVETSDDYITYFTVVDRVTPFDHTTLGINRVNGVYELYNVAAQRFSVNKVWRMDEKADGDRVGVAWDDDLVKDLKVNIELFRVPIGSGIPFGSSVQDVPAELRLGTVPDGMEKITDTTTYPPGSNEAQSEHIQFNVPESGDDNGFVYLDYPGVEGWYIVVGNSNWSIAAVRSGEAIKNRGLVKFSGRILDQSDVEYRNASQLRIINEEVYGNAVKLGDIIRFNGMLWIYIATDYDRTDPNAPGGGNNDWYCLQHASYASGGGGSADLHVHYVNQNEIIDVLNHQDADDQLKDRAWEPVTSAKVSVNGAEATAIDANDKVFELTAGSDASHPWRCTFEDLPTGYVYFAGESIVDGDDITQKNTPAFNWYDTKYNYSFDNDTNSGSVTIDNRIPDYIARVRNKPADGAWSSWTYHRYLITPSANTIKTGTWEGAFNKANTLTGEVEVELLKRGPENGVADDTLEYGQSGTSRYTLNKGFSFNGSNLKSLTIRTAPKNSDGLWNRDGSTSVIRRGWSENNSAMFTVSKTFTIDNVILDGKEGDAQRVGRAINATGGELTVKNCTFRNFSNTGESTLGGGAIKTTVAATIANSSFWDCKITGSSDTYGGGAIYTTASITIRNDTEEEFGFYRCTSNTSGGGVQAQYGNSSNDKKVTVENTSSGKIVFDHCSGNNDGGAIDIDKYGTFAMKNTGTGTISFSDCYSDAGGIVCIDHGDVNITNTNDSDPENSGKVEVSRCYTIKNPEGKQRGGGGIFASNVSITNDGEIAFDGCYVTDNNNEGGGIYCGGNLSIVGTENVSSGKLSFENCGANKGGGIYAGGAVTTAQAGEVSFTDCTAKTNGGGAYIGGVASLENTVSFKSCRVDSADTATCGGGGAWFNGAATLNGSIKFEDCYTNASGGAMYLASGGTLTGVNVDGHKDLDAGISNASMGGAFYLASGKTATIVGGEYKNCSASAENGGAVNVGGDRSVLNFGDDAVIYNNPSVAGDGVQQKNVVLDQNVNTVIKTTENGVKPFAHIGIYVTGSSAENPYQSHGEPGNPFGTRNGSDQGAYLFRFTNDRNGCWGEKHADNDMLIYWNDPICKLTDKYNNLLFEQKYHDEDSAKSVYLPAVYNTLNDGVVAAEGSLYDAKGTAATPMSSTNEIRLKMLKDYTIPATDLVTLKNAADNIVLTTAETKNAYDADATLKTKLDGNGDVFFFVPVEDFAGRTQTDSNAKAILRRGAKDGSLFTAEDASAKLSTNNIVLDGGAKFKSDGTNEGLATIARGGIIYVAAGALSVGNGTIVRNSESTSEAEAPSPGAGGGAIYVATGASLSVTGEYDASKDVVDSENPANDVVDPNADANVTRFENCRSASYGGAIFVSDGMLNIIGTVQWPTGATDAQKKNRYGIEFDSCVGQGGGAVFHSEAGSETRIELAKFTNCQTRGTADKDKKKHGGGGVQSRALKMTLNNNLFDGCSAVAKNGDGENPYQGGGAFHCKEVSGSKTVVTGCDYSNCFAIGGGGAMESYARTIGFKDCSFDGCYNKGAKDGGALNFFNENSKVTIQGCTFVNCWTNQKNGGAVRSYSSETTIIDSDFVRCKTGRNGDLGSGGAVRLDKKVGKTTKGWISGCSFEDCSAKDGGAVSAVGTNDVIGAHEIKDDNGTVTEVKLPCTFTRCTASNNGGAVYLDAENSVSVVGSTFTSCSAKASGGGVYVKGKSEKEQTLTTSTFINCSGANGGAIYVESGLLEMIDTSKRSEFLNCTATENGGAIYLKADLSNKTWAELNLYDNSFIFACVAQRGPGIYISEGAKLRIKGELGFGGMGVTADGSMIAYDKKQLDNNANSLFHRYSLTKEGQKVYLDDVDGRQVYYLVTADGLYKVTSTVAWDNITESSQLTYLETDDGGKPKSIDENLPYIGNMTSGAASENSTNGYKPIDKFRQDIYIAGYANGDAESLILTDAITSGEGSIWVFADNELHYKQNMQFAKMDFPNTYKPTEEQLETVLKSFRNAGSDSDTDNGTESFLYGVADDKNINWNGVSGSRRVILRKINTGYESLEGARFIAYKGTNPTCIKVGEDKVDFNFTSNSTGVIWVGELSYGTYYLNEVEAPEGYTSGKWFYFILDSEHKMMSEAYESRDAAKTVADDYNKAIKLANQIIEGKVTYEEAIGTGVTKARLDEMLTVVGRSDLIQ